MYSYWVIYNLSKIYIKTYKEYHEVTLKQEDHVLFSWGSLCQTMWEQKN